MGHGMYGWNMGWGMGFGWIYMILFWAGIVAGIVFLVKWISSQSQSNPKQGFSETPMEIVEKRYAAGEISEKEFRNMRDNLKGGSK